MDGLYIRWPGLRLKDQWVFKIVWRDFVILSSATFPFLSFQQLCKVIIVEILLTAPFHPGSNFCSRSHQMELSLFWLKNKNQSPRKLSSTFFLSCRPLLPYVHFLSKTNWFHSLNIFLLWIFSFFPLSYLPIGTDSNHSSFIPHICHFFYTVKFFGE